ncbi:MULTISPECIES: hypothetical protein [Nostoc]|uniref:Uncharacterized protein n=1 Tax=Nostoc paludosum FACHB-159 TaxID=2692908 RepID=A0ABR8KIN5_9NOSO|nr:MULTISPECIES: hypothetical protein [Nostoc]MBD2683088.1 hypothetical protein [Nostoc sp. FACHB-857]MBD2739431.1 hypothetical protein [Nostoc paludosum FACHB-159]
MNINQRQRSEKQRDTLQAEWDLRNEKLKQLRLALAIEAGAVVKFQLQQQIQAEETELKRLNDELHTIEQALYTVNLVESPPIDPTPSPPMHLHRRRESYPHSKPSRGKVSFNYSHHDGFYRLGDGNYEFLTHWSKASDTTIHCYQDATNVSVALAPKNTRLQDITDASLYNFTSRVRSPEIGQFVLLENHSGRYAAVNILKIQDDSRGDSEDLLVFDYWILEDGSDDFSNVA